MSTSQVHSSVGFPVFDAKHFSTFGIQHLRLLLGRFTETLVGFFCFDKDGIGWMLRGEIRKENIRSTIVFEKNWGGGSNLFTNLFRTTFVLFCGPPENRPKDDGKPPKTAENRPKDD